MLGRTANDLYWLARYVERAESMARLIEVGYRIALLPREQEGGYNEEWRSTLASAGCADGFFAKYEHPNGRDVINYLLFDTSNPSSVQSCLAAARRNGRAQRIALTRDMWEALNDAWMEFSKIKPEEVTANELPRLLDWIRSRSALYRGAMLNTILRSDTYYFSQIGTFLERADNTARILDVKYFVLLPEIEMVGTGVDNVQWGAILRSVSAHRSYRWVYKQNYKPWRIAEYLMFNPAMPRSLRACYDMMNASFEGLAQRCGGRQKCHATMEETRRFLAEGDINAIFQSGLHEFLVDFISRNHRLGCEVAEAYHFNG
jgi:uncharacterized alpha-E superfamily protein